MQNAKPLSRLARKPRVTENFIQGFLFLCGLLSVVITVGIVYELAKEALLFFSNEQWENSNKSIVMDLGSNETQFEVSTSGRSFDAFTVIRVDDEKMYVLEVDGALVIVERGFQDTQGTGHAAGRVIYTSTLVTLREFFTTTEWIPQLGKFGIWPLVTATLMTSMAAILVAVPLGLSVAIFLSEYASQRLRSALKPTLEVLAGIPTVVYGYFALTFMTPLLRQLFGMQVEIYNTASAGIVIGILIIPLVSSMSEDALSAVPRALREASYALGATKLETALRVVVPAAISGIAAGIIVAISRAIGETMIVAIAAGAGPNFTLNPFKAAETMTGHIVRISGGDISYDSIDYNSIFSIGLLLFLMTMTLNIFSQWIVNRFREEYE